MRRIHIGTAAINTTPMDWEGNTGTIIEVIKEARSRQVGLLCLPELCITGYGCEDDFHAPYVQHSALAILMQEILPITDDIAVCIGLPLSYQGVVFNVIALVVNQKLCGFVAKRHLAGDGIHYEPRFFKPWPKQVVGKIEVDAGFNKKLVVPIGDLVFSLAGIRLGFEICEDAWVASRPGVDLAGKNVNIILNPSASHFSLLKRHIRERFVVEGSRAFNCVYAYANLLGNEAGRAIYDGDCMIASGGDLLAKGKRFSFRPWLLTSAIADIQVNQVKRSRIASLQSELTQDYAIGIDFNPSLEENRKKELPTVSQHETCSFENSIHLKEEEFTRAVTLGLWDYLRKARASGFAVSLSGGADSATCATMVHLMVKFALHDNPEDFFSYTGFEKDNDIRNLTGKLLACVYQGTINSGKTTENAAQMVAHGTGAQFQIINVQPLVERYEKILAQWLERAISWDQDDLTRQNIQARCRAPSIWAIANAENYLLITTSNRSEAAVGYCTMDGDTCGSLAPIAGIDKAFLLKWLKWAEKVHLPELRAVNSQQPTAELRPATEKQTDEKDLMPYPLLNFMQKAAVIDKLSPIEIYLRIKDETEFPKTYSIHDLYVFIERYFTLWSRNQWKRERYAPSFHLDDENLDPKTWCRFPILSGGYRYELKALRDLLGI